MSRRRVTGGVAALGVVLALAGCGRLADRLGHEAPTPASQSIATTPGESPASPYPAASTPREDEPTPAVDGPSAADVTELQQALGAADKLADEVDRDIASDGS